MKTVFGKDTVAVFDRTSLRKTAKNFSERSYYRSLYKLTDSTLAQNYFLLDSARTLFLQGENNYKKALQLKDEEYQKAMKAQKRTSFFGKLSAFIIGAGTGILVYQLTK